MGALRHGSGKCDRDFRRCKWLRVFKPVEGHRERRVTYHMLAGASAAQVKVVHLYQLAFWLQLTFSFLITF